MAQGTRAVIRAHIGLVVHGFRLEERMLVPVATPTRTQWMNCLHYLMRLERHIHFWLGHLMQYGEERWGEDVVRQMVAASGYDYGTLCNDQWVAKAVPASNRYPTLPFAHHQEVARLHPAQQRVVLAQAEREKWTRVMVRQETFRRTHAVPKSAISPRLDPGLHHGDCREILERLPDRSVHLLLTDPPYGLNYESPTRIVPFPHMANDDGEEALILLDEVLGGVARKLAADSRIYVFTSWKTYARMVDVVANHFPLLGTLPWIKNNWGVGDLAGGYGEQHEFVMSACRGRSPHRWEGGALHFDRVGTNQMRHPTQKPVPMLEHLIRTSSREGDTVLDPFMGSGSSCVAARNTKRRYVGIEIARQWYEQALQRLADPTSED